MLGTMIAYTRALLQAVVVLVSSEPFVYLFAVILLTFVVGLIYNIIFYRR